MWYYKFESIEKIILHVNIVLRYFFTFFCLFHFILLQVLFHFSFYFIFFEKANSFFKKVSLTFKFITNCFQYYQTIFQFTYLYQYQWHDLNQQELLRSMLKRARSQARFLENSSNLVALIRNSEKKEDMN